MYFYYVTNELDRAVRAYRSLVELSDSTSRSGLKNLAIMYYNLGDFARAEALVENMLEQGLRSNPIYQNLWLYQLHQGKLEAAEATLDEWTEYYPNSVSNIQGRATTAIQRGDFIAAEQYASGIKQVWRIEQPESYWVDPDRQLGHVAALQGKVQQAADYYGVAIRESKIAGAGRPYLLTSTCLAMLDIWFRADPEAGIAKIEEALSQYPLDSMPATARPYLELVHLYAAAGRPDQARAFFDEFDAEVDPLYRTTWEQPNERSALAAVALAEGRYRDVIEQSHLGMRRAHPFGVFLPMLARAFEALGETDSAIVVYERYVEPSTARRIRATASATGVIDTYWWPTSYLRLAGLYEQRGDTTNALHYYSKFVDFWKDSDPELQPQVGAARRAIETLSRHR